MYSFIRKLLSTNYVLGTMDIILSKTQSQSIQADSKGAWSLSLQIVALGMKGYPDSPLPRSCQR